MTDNCKFWLAYLLLVAVSLWLGGCGSIQVLPTLTHPRSRDINFYAPVQEIPREWRDDSQWL